MGCSGSIAHPAVIQSITKVDVATNTTVDDFFSSPIPQINSVKHMVEVDVQTEDLQSDIKKNQTTSSNENDKRDSNLKSDDEQKISNNRDESVDPIDNFINPRFNQDFNDQEELEWILNDLDANQFCLNNQTLLMSASQVTSAMVVDAIVKTDDLKHVTKVIWDLLNKAKTSEDATYLIRAYTAESNFYKILNRRLARQSLGNPTNMTLEQQLQSMMSNAFAQFGNAISTFQAFQAGQQLPFQNSTETDWSRLYLQAIYRLIMIPNSTLRYQGKTYRGMRLTLEQLEHYVDKTYVCNKAITSTSKLRPIAQNFIESGPRPENMYDVMFIYIVESFSALLAIDVHTFSLIPEEEEVLIMPGILFSIGKPKIIGPYSMEIEMRSAFQELANGGFANSLTGLFSAFEPEFD
jgi:hypothetical protein